MVECGGLENRCTERYRGFESLILRQSLSSRISRRGFLPLELMGTIEKPFQRESHLRSIIKGFTWRVIAFVDTMAMTMLVTWMIDGKPHIEAGLSLGGFGVLA